MINQKINKTNDPILLRAIMCMLMKSAYLGIKINNKMIDERINKEKKMKEYIEII